MNKSLAFLEINLILLLKDKLSFVWSILFPTILLIINQNNINTFKDLRFWWIYVVFTSFLYGVGVHALRLKESGVMRMVFSITHSPFSFFVGLFLTQIVYNIICLVTFNLVATLIVKTELLSSILYSLKSIIYCIPIAFIGYNLTLLKKIHVNTVVTIVNMVTFSLFILMGSGSELNKINPLYILSNQLLKTGFNDLIPMLIISTIAMLLSLPSIINYTCISNERR